MIMAGMDSFGGGGLGLRDVPGGQCHLCGGEIAEVKWYGSWSAPGGGGFWFSGRCPDCDVDYRLALQDRRSAGWNPDAPEPGELRAEIGADELAALSIKFDRYVTLGPKWHSFLGRRRTGDAVWRFASADGWHNGFAVVRGGRPVSRFAVLGPV
ncbi:MAG: hypothetical protein ACRCZF_21065 [Gemmataceae bacterium]